MFLSNIPQLAQLGLNCVRVNLVVSMHLLTNSRSETIGLSLKTIQVISVHYTNRTTSLLYGWYFIESTIFHESQIDSIFLENCIYCILVDHGVSNLAKIWTPKVTGKYLIVRKTARAEWVPFSARLVDGIRQMDLPVNTIALQRPNRACTPWSKFTPSFFDLKSWELFA